MSCYPIELDKERTFKFGMKAVDRIEKKYKKSIMEIEGMQNGALSAQDYAFLIHAGLMHEDKDLTPEKVMDIVDEYSTMGKVTKVMWQAFNENFKTGAEDEIKVEVLTNLKAMLDSGMIEKEEVYAVINSEKTEEKNE